MQKRIKQNLRFAGQYADDSIGLHYNTFQGIEGMGTRETGIIGRRATNGGNVRGNNIHGVDPTSSSAMGKIRPAQKYLNGRSPSKMPALNAPPKNGQVKSC